MGNNKDDDSNGGYDIAGLLFMIGGVSILNPLQFTPLFLVGIILYIGISPIAICAIVAFFSIFYFSRNS